MEKTKSNQNDTIDLVALLWNFIRTFRKLWWIIPILVMAFAAVGAYSSNRFYTPMYRSTSSFTVMTGTEEEIASGTYSYYYNQHTASQMGKTFPYLLSSSLLTDLVMEELGTNYLPGSISAYPISDSNLFTIEAYSTNPEDAKRLVEATLKVYPKAARYVLGNVSFNMIEQPTLPTQPYNKRSYLGEAKKYALIGAALSVVIIFLIAFLRKTIQKPDDVKKLVNLENLGSVPEPQSKARFHKEEITFEKHLSILNKKANTSYKESINGLLLRLEQEAAERKAKIIMFTSTVPSEGKSTISLNTAFAAAKAGKRVLFLDFDLRKQETRSMLTNTDGPGIEDIINGKVDFMQAMHRDEKSGIYYIGGSKACEDPYSLIHHRLMDSFMKMLRKAPFDLIILDTPPCLAFEDAGSLATYTDGIVYILRYDFIEPRRFMHAISFLNDTEVPILGYVMNRVPVHSGSSSYNGYGYGIYGYGYYGKYGYGYGEYGKSKSNS